MIHLLFLIYTKNYNIIVNATDNLQKTTLSWWYATNVYRMIAQRGERMKFCDKLQKIRKENNITQEQLADKLNVSRQAVSKWESGQAYPDTEKLIQISKIFKISLDELINDNIDTNKVNNKKKFDFMETFNLVFESIRKVFTMFFSMKFTEKIKFLIEMALIILAIYLTSSLINEVILNLIRRIFGFLPYQVFNVIDYLIYTILYVGWLILGVMIFIRVLKIRYLDYYVIITDENISKQVIEEPIKELKEKKGTKIVIRDPEHSSLSILKRMGKILLILFKCFCILLLIPIVLGFIAFVILLVISLMYLFSGLFFNGITIAVLGIILFIYLLIKFIYNVIFDRNNNYNRMFVIFIISISLIGCGIGLSFAAFSTFDTYSENDFAKNKQTLEIAMSDDLVVFDIINADNDKIVIDDNLDDIKLDLIVYGNNMVRMYTYSTYDFDDGEYNMVEIANIYVDYDELEFYRTVINDFKHKKINTYNRYDNGYEIDKIYISSKNLTKIRENCIKVSN